MLSVIIPAYNEEANIPKTSEVIRCILENANIQFEILFVNDGSKDGTWKAITLASQGDERVRGLCFSRNFGKEAAMFAGLASAAGDCSVIIDCDLQHPPEKIVEMYRLWEQGYEVVEGMKEDRGKESKIYAFAAKIFYSLISKAVDIDMSSASDFKLMDRKVVDVLLNIPEKNVFFRAISSWIGFKSVSVPYSVREREYGESKWSTGSLIKYAVSNITSFSAAPMQLVTILGVSTLLFSCIFSLITLIQKFSGSSIDGFATVIIMLGFIGSMIMISMGIIGYYIEKIYDEIKGRPRYIVSCEIGKRKVPDYDKKVFENLP